MSVNVSLAGDKFYLFFHFFQASADCKCNRGEASLTRPEETLFLDTSSFETEALLTKWQVIVPSHSMVFSSRQWSFEQNVVPEPPEKVANQRVKNFGGFQLNFET